MRPPGPTIHSSRILAAIALCLTPLLASAQTYESDTAGTPAEAVQSSTSPAPPARSAPHRTSLMGMVMAALIQSAEQSERQHRDAARHAAVRDASRPPQRIGGASQKPDPALAKLHEDAIRSEAVVRTDEPL